MRRFATAAFSLPILFSGCSESAGPAARDTHVTRLDWQAPSRWVHVDNIAHDKIELFEGARRRWLVALGSPGRRLDDGRALFWSGDHNGMRTYLTFYPFTDFAGLDRRAQTAAATQLAVGKAAVDDYDSGDAALVPPHYTQLWTRAVDEDFVAPGASDISELGAEAALIEFQQAQFQHGDRADDVWKQVTAALARANYPLTCRTFRSRYGDGRTVRLWLAADMRMLESAPGLADALRGALGDAAGASLASEYRVLWASTGRIPDHAARGPVEPRAVSAARTMHQRQRAPTQTSPRGPPQCAGTQTAP